MRILHISTRLILGGSQENTVLSCEGQTRLGHDVHLAFGPIFGPEGSLFERASNFRCRDPKSNEELRIGMHEVKSMVREINPIKDFRCYFALRSLIRDLRPDIVHTHSSKAGVLGRAAAWTEAARMKKSGHKLGVVHTIHGPPFHKFLPKRTNAIYVASEKFAARRCHRIVSVANAMTEQFLAEKIGTSDQYSTVYSGMEVDRYLDARDAAGKPFTSDTVRDSLGLSPMDFVIGTVARLAELKGHDDLLDALGTDLKANPNWKLLWVGDGWWRDRLLKRVADMGLADRVVTTGLVPSERVPEMMRAMDVLVHPSYREGLPRTVPQALLCGVPVIAYDVDGTKEICLDGKTGFLLQPRDLEGLRLAVKKMYDAPDERTRMANTGRELCRVRFSAETMVAELEKVYAQALALA
ncbi:MAG: glycosyltransferase family 4 protein [Phycisphaeraceae bacterium]|nr:glycosyltransferase family 4 protein [Phycisphaeraceae bacterium]